MGGERKGRSGGSGERAEVVLLDRSDGELEEGGGLATL
jgi:hypothetical protein